MTVFGGLVTFLFVASGDTPKVPYQTRLDVFMLFSFLNVAVMLVIHGALYYWRECDIEDFLAEQQSGGGDEQQGSGGTKSVAPGADVEMAEQRQQSGGSSRQYVNDPSGSSSPSAQGSSAVSAAAAVRKLDKWYLRKNQRHTHPQLVCLLPAVDNAATRFLPTQNGIRFVFV